MGRREAAQPICEGTGRQSALPSSSARRCVSLARSYVPRRCRGNGVQLGLEANVVALLPVSAGDGSLHAGALGADGVQFHVGVYYWNGTLHWLCFHASTYNGHLALF